MQGIKHKAHELTYVPESLNSKIFIGISGKAGSGKDTLAKLLLDKLQQMRKTVSIIPLAAALKDCCRFNFGVDAQAGKESMTIFGCTVRKLYQYLGSEAMRTLDEYFWIKLWLYFKVIPRMDVTDVFIVPDVRFPNEFWTLKRLGGYLIRLEREGSLEGEEAQHQSETALDDLAVKDADLIIPAGLSPKETLNATWEGMALKNLVPHFDFSK